MKTNETFLSKLAPAARALETWRRTRRHRQPIPEVLWKQIVGVARHHGVSSVSEALRLNYYSLKRRVEESAGATDFVEVKMAPTPEKPSGCTAQMEDGQGRKLLLHWSSPGPELLGVVQAFWSQGA